MPPDVPTAQVIERLVTVLPAMLKRHNRAYNDSSRIQLRVAVEVGPIEEDEAGVSGKVDHRRLPHVGFPRFQVFSVSGGRGLEQCLATG